MEGMNSMGMHALNMQAIEGLDLPGSMQSGFMQPFEDMEHPQNHHTLYQLEHGDHIPQQLLAHEQHHHHHQQHNQLQLQHQHQHQHLSYVPSTQASQQEEKQEQQWLLSFPVMQQQQTQHQLQYQHQHQQQLQQMQAVSESTQSRRGSRPRAPGTKPRQSYSLDFKLHAIKTYDQLQAISPAATALGLPKKGGRKMLRDWVKNRDKIAAKFQEGAATSANSQGGMRKIHPGKKPALSEEQEQQIHDWYLAETNSGRTVSNKEIAEKAREIANLENFKASSRWMMRFKRKVGLPTHGKQDRKRMRTEGQGGSEVDVDVDGSDQSFLQSQHLLSNDTDQLGGDQNIFIQLPQGLYTQDDGAIQYMHSMSAGLMPDYSRQYPVTSTSGSLYDPEPGTAIHVTVQEIPHMHMHIPTHPIIMHHPQAQTTNAIISQHPLVVGSYPSNPEDRQQPQTSQPPPTDQHDTTSSSFQVKTVAV